MSGPDDSDTTPPPAERPTLDELPPANDDAFGTVTLPPVIPMGQASAALDAAIHDFWRAYTMLEAVASAACRALDAQAEPEAP